MRSTYLTVAAFSFLGACVSILVYLFTFLQQDTLVCAAIMADGIGIFALIAAVLSDDKNV